MEQEVLNENGFDNLSREELMTNIQDHCAKQAKCNRVLAILWLAALPFASAWAFNSFRGFSEKWFFVLLPLTVGIMCLYNVLWYGKMSKCGDSKQLLRLFSKGSIWFNVVSAIPSFLLGFASGWLCAGLKERHSVPLYAAVISIIALAAFTIILSSSKKRSIKNNLIEDLREHVEQEQDKIEANV